MSAYREYELSVVSRVTYREGEGTFHDYNPTIGFWTISPSRRTPSIPHGHALLSSSATSPAAGRCSDCVSTAARLPDRQSPRRLGRRRPARRRRRRRISDSERGKRGSRTTTTSRRRLERLRAATVHEGKVIDQKPNGAR